MRYEQITSDLLKKAKLPESLGLNEGDETEAFSMLFAYNLSRKERMDAENPEHPYYQAVRRSGKAGKWLMDTYEKVIGTFDVTAKNLLDDYKNRFGQSQTMERLRPVLEQTANFLMTQLYYRSRESGKGYKDIFPELAPYAERFRADIDKARQVSQSQA